MGRKFQFAELSERLFWKINGYFYFLLLFAKFREWKKKWKNIKYVTSLKLHPKGSYPPNLLERCFFLMQLFVNTNSKELRSLDCLVDLASCSCIITYHIRCLLTPHVVVCVAIMFLSTLMFLNVVLAIQFLIFFKFDA